MPVSFRGVCLFAVGATFVASCADQDRSRDAATAKQTLIGKSKAEILTCMGPPERESVADGIESLSYSSGDHEVVRRSTNATANLLGAALGTNHETRNCRVNLTLANGRVTNVLYSGATGGWASKDEQCGYVVKNCVGH